MCVGRERARRAGWGGCILHILILDNLEDEIFPSVKYKIKTLDLDNFTYSMAVMDGEEDESTLSEMKVDTVSRWMLQIYTKYIGINDDQVESKKEQVAQ
ncbi:hypothetical protein Tco_0935991 [Tanacetum coccineum]